MGFTDSGKASVAFPLQYIKHRADAALASMKDGDAASLLYALRLARLDLEKAEVNAVREARFGGMTWLEIGNSLGVSKQAAQQKYGSKKPAGSPDLPPVLDGLDN